MLLLRRVRSRGARWGSHRVHIKGRDSRVRRRGRRIRSYCRRRRSYRRCIGRCGGRVGCHRRCARRCSGRIGRRCCGCIWSYSARIRSHGRCVRRHRGSIGRRRVRAWSGSHAWRSRALRKACAAQKSHQHSSEDNPFHVGFLTDIRCKAEPKAVQNGQLAVLKRKHLCCKIELPGGLRFCLETG